MAITVNDKDLGMVTAYAYALAGGYTGTEAEFEALLGNIAKDLAEIENLSVQVQTLPAGSDATASYADGVLTLGIPRGDKGETGDQGEIGPTPQLSVGTVTTGEPGTDAEVEITGTPEAPVLNFTIPRGDTGNITQAVRYDAAQTLTDAQKEQARANIDAADAGEVAELKSALSAISDNVIYTDFQHDKWYSESNSQINIDDGPTYHVGADCIKIACTPGDIFTITGNGGTSSHRLWAFTDISGNTIGAKASSDETAINKTITAPSEAAYLIVNVEYAVSPYLLIGETLLKNKVQELVNWTETEIPFKANGYANDQDLNDYTTTGWYVWAASHVPIHAPWSVALGGRLFVIGDQNTNTTTIQIAISVDDVPQIYVRRKSSTRWYDWTAYLHKKHPELPIYSDIAAHFDGNGVVSSGFYIATDIEENDDRSILFDIEAKYTGTEKPVTYFQSFATNGNRIYSSCKYAFNSSTEYIKQSFRIPNSFQTKAFRMYFTIPEGSTLAIRNFSCRYEDYVRKGTGNVIFHAHRGLDKYYAPGTYNAIVAAARLGFESCIGIPKFTSDDVAVEFHDDGNISSAMAQTDGTAIPAEYDKPISQLTYAELMQFSAGVKYGAVYADDKILKMDDFLRICAETGMRPIFSIHLSTRPNLAQWQALKSLTDKYGLTKYLSVKTGSETVCDDVITTFGNGGLYSIILLYDDDSEDSILQRIDNWSTYHGLDITKTRLDCEFFENALFDESTATWQQAQLAAAKGAGYVISAVLKSGSDQSTEGTRALMDLGVTEFTDLRMYSINLNW